MRAPHCYESPAAARSRTAPSTCARRRRCASRRFSTRPTAGSPRSTCCPRRCATPATSSLRATATPSSARSVDFRLIVTRALRRWRNVARSAREDHGRSGLKNPTQTAARSFEQPLRRHLGVPIHFSIFWFRPHSDRLSVDRESLRADNVARCAERGLGQAATCREPTPRFEARFLDNAGGSGTATPHAGGASPPWAATAE